MGNSPVARWLRAVSPALIWLLLRHAGKGLPPAVGICLEAALAAAAWWLFRREKGKTGFRLEGKAGLLFLGIGMLWGLAGRLCFGKPAGQENSLAAFFRLCILGPAAEEILYRGLVEGRLRRLLPENGAAAVSALLFAAAHDTPARMACALAAGILFSVAFRKTGSLAVPVLMHMVINMAAFC
ncbi:MAG: CPBP family intramembrane metalloprotease [Clostridia bacterium]|nr:CPBP family intramembrane metalloprotease [Clostridia bacterium]